MNDSIDQSTRAAHLAWSKARAAHYLDRNEHLGAWISFVADMSKHDELRNHLMLEAGTRLILAGRYHTATAMRELIESFN